MIFVVSGNRAQADEFERLSGRKVKYVSCVQDLMGYRRDDMDVYYFGNYDLREDLHYLSHVLKSRGVEPKHISWMDLENHGLG